MHCIHSLRDSSSKTIGFGWVAFTPGIWTTCRASSNTPITLTSLCERWSAAMKSCAPGIPKLINNTSTVKSNCMTSSAASGTLLAGKAEYDAASSACPSQKTNPRSSSIMRTVFSVGDSPFVGTAKIELNSNWERPSPARAILSPYLTDDNSMT